MAGTGIWLSDQDLLQTGGAIWAQQQIHQVTARASAGQDWATQQIQRLQQQAAAQVQAAAPGPAATPPTPPVAPALPTPQAITPPTPAPIQAPTPAPAAPPLPGTTPTSEPPSPPAPAPSMAASLPQVPDMAKVGDDWASEQIQKLLNPTPAAPQPTPTPQPALAPTSTSTPSAGPPGATAGPLGTAPGAAPSSGIDASSPSAFAKSFAPYAQYAAQQLGIDPTWVAAMAGSESNYGKAQGNELFGVKALPGQKGTTMMTHEGEYGGTNMNQTFAAYDTPQDSVDAWVNLIKNHYPGAVNAPDLASFVHGLKQGGYFTAAEPEYLGIVQGIANRIGGDVQGALQGAQNAVGNALQTGKQTVQNLVSGAQDVAQKGVTAVNNGVQAVQAAVARTSQFAMGLSSGDAMAFCGPAAAMAFAQTFGRNPTVDEAKQLAQQVGWNAQQGMAGVGSEVALLKNLGVDAHATNGVDWAAVGRDAQAGNPVIIETADHYFYVDGYNPDTGQFHLGSSATDLKANPTKQEWFKPGEIPGLGQGAPRAAIFADHPLAQSNGLAQSTASSSPTQGPTYMSTLQPASTSSSTSSNPAMDLLSSASSAVQNKAQDVLSAVQNVGGNALNAGQNLLGSAPDLGANLPGAGLLPDLTAPRGRSVTPPPQNLGADLPDIGGLLTVDPRTPLGRMVNGTPIGQLSPGDQVQALMQWNQQYEQARAAGTENLTGNTPLLSGLASIGTDPEQLLALAGGGALGNALLPGAGIGANIGRQALTGALAGGAYGAGQPSASPLDILGNAAFGGGLGAAGGAAGALPGFLRGLGQRDAAVSDPLTGGSPTLSDLLRGASDVLYSPRGVALDPLTGQEMIPSGLARLAGPVTTDLAATANPATVLQPEPMQSSDLITGLRNLLSARQATAGNAPLAEDFAAQLPRSVDEIQADLAQAQRQYQYQRSTASGDASRGGRMAGEAAQQRAAAAARQTMARMRDLQAELDAAKQGVPLGGAQSGAINAAFARALGGGAAGGLGTYAATDENDPNRWLKVAGGVGAGALAGGPGVDLALQAAANPAVRNFLTDESGQLNLGAVAQPPGQQAGAPAAANPGLWNTIGRSIQAGRIGALAGGIPTVAHIAFNAPVQTGLKLLSDVPASVLTGHPEAVPAEMYGALQGLRSWALTAAQTLRQPGPLAQSMGGGVGPQALETGLTGLVRVHPVLQDVARQMATNMDLWRGAATEATNAGLARGSPAWQAEVARLVANPTAAMTDSAQHAGDTAALGGAMGTTGQAVADAVRRAPMLRFILPIFNIGYHVAAQGLETSPLGALGTLADVGRAAVGQGPYAGAQGFAGRGAADAVTPLAQRIRNNLIGVGLAYEAYNQAAQGNITGEGPSDPQQQAALRATGWQPDSVRIGGRYFDAHLLGPVGWSLIQGANAYEATHPPEEGGTLKPIETPQGLRAPGPQDVLGDLVARQGRYFNNETFLSSLGSALNAIGSGTQKGKIVTSELGNVAQSLIPQGALLANAASAVDPYARQARGSTPIEQFEQQIETRIPGLRETVSPRLTATGEPQPNPQLGVGLLMPRSNVINADPVLLAMAGAGVTPSSAPTDVPYGPSAKVMLTPNEQQAWAQYRGQILQQAAVPLVNSPGFQRMPPQAQHAALQNVNDAASSAASRMVLADIAGGPGAGMSRMIGTGALAAVNSYAPVGLGDPQAQYTMLRNQAQHAALMQALLGGQSGVQAMIAANAAAANYV